MRSLDFGSGAWTLGFELWAFNLTFNCPVWALGFQFLGFYLLGLRSCAGVIIKNEVSV